MDNTVEEYISSWNGRLRSSLLDMLILKESAYSTDPVYPYSIAKKLQELWGERNAPPLPTVYSVINRMEGKGFIQFSEEIQGGRVQKKILIQPIGYDLLDEMNKEIEAYKRDISALQREIL